MGITFTWRTLRYAIGLGLIVFMAHADLRARETASITAVDVQQENGATRIVLKGAQDAIYTAFMREDPPRLIIELPNLTFDGVDAPINVDNGLVNDVTLGTFGDAELGHSMARVSIGLARESEYEVIPSGNEIVVVLRNSGGPDGSMPVPAAPADVQSEEPEIAKPLSDGPDVVAPESVHPQNTDEEIIPAAADEAMASASESSATEEAPSSIVAAVSKITVVTASDGGLEVKSDGPIDNVDSFTLTDPDRLVMDFWGAKSMVWPDRVSYEEGTVSRIRVGEHADKVRVVLDLRWPLLSHKLVPSPSGAWVNLEADMSAAVETETPEVPAAPANEEANEIGSDMNAETPEMPQPEVAEEAVVETVETVEVAETENKLEEVMEALSNETQPAAMSEPTADSMAQKTEEAPELTAEMPQASLPPVVESVHFESLPGMDRIVVSFSGSAAATTVEPDPATVIVMMPGATVTSENERRVDTTEFGGPVKMFSVFQTPDIEGNEVRVVLRRNSDKPATLNWDDGQLRIEMERDETAEAKMPAPQNAMPVGPAATPPVAPVTQAPAAIAPSATKAATPAEYDPFLDGPANPAAIDILEEGGFDEEKAYEGRRISLDFKDADIANILRLIAEVSDLNVIAGAEVAGRVTIRLVDVPWDQALDVILLTKGLGFVRIGNILRIAPVETLKLEREARLQERRAREKLEDLVVKLQPVNYAKASSMRKLVKRLLSSRGSVNVDKRTNTLIIKDIPSVIHEATALVKAIDTQTPQVMIETKIVEASLNFSRGLGASWGAGIRPPPVDNVHGLGSSSLLGLSGGQQNNFFSTNPVFAATGLLNLGLLTLDDHLQLDLQLAAQEESGKSKVISSPRVVTLDNKEAVIKQGVAIKFAETTDDKITVSFIDAVLQLKVTPHITANRSIIMKIKVARNAPSLSTVTGDVVGIEKNETKTEAIVRDGETMVLGGIYVVENGGTQSKVPFLADIPILGAAFRSKSIQDERRELLVFVTPRVIQVPGTDL